MVSGLGISNPAFKVSHSYQDIDTNSPLQNSFKSKIPPQPNSKSTIHSYKRKQIRKKRRKMSDSSSISASTASSPPSSTFYDQTNEQYIRQIVGRIFTKLYKHLDTHTSKFNYRTKHSDPNTVTIDTDRQNYLNKNLDKITPSTKPNTQEPKKNNRRKYKKRNNTNSKYKPKPNHSNHNNTSLSLPTSCSVPIVPTFSFDEFPPLASESSYLNELDKQISKFIQEVTSKVFISEDGRYHILGKIQDIVNTLYPNAQVHLYGSFATGLALPSSDLDVAILGSDLYGIKEIRYGIMELGRVFQYYSWVSRCAVITTASVPVIKLIVDTSSISGVSGEIHVDISFEDEDQVNSAGIASMRLTQELLNLYPLMHPILLVVKQMLANNSLNSAYKGGISSYSLVLWIVSFINSLDEVPILASDLLIQFLRYYGKEFNPLLTGINIRNGRSYYRLQSSLAHAVTIDPLNSYVNTTRGSYNISKVLSLFSSAHFQLISSGIQSNLLESILDLRIT